MSGRILFWLGCRDRALQAGGLEPQFFLTVWRLEVQDRVPANWFLVGDLTRSFLGACTRRGERGSHASYRGCSYGIRTPPV